MFWLAFERFLFSSIRFLGKEDSIHEKIASKMLKLLKLSCKMRKASFGYFILTSSSFSFRLSVDLKLLP